LRAAIARARTEKERETAAWKYLATRRDWWARQFAISAATLKSAMEVDPTLWLSFAAVAQALLDGRSLKRIPIMSEIVDMTLEAAEARDGDVPPISRTSAPDEIGLLAAQAGISEAYLQGYLTALAIAPLEPSPQDWLGSPLSGIEVSGEGAINHLMGLVMMHANQVNDDASDPKAVAAAPEVLSEDELTNWAAGFNDPVTATRRCWPPKHLGADDERILNDIDRIAQGADGKTLRRVLPSWGGQTPRLAAIEIIERGPQPRDNETRAYTANRTIDDVVPGRGQHTPRAALAHDLDRARDGLKRMSNAS